MQFFKTTNIDFIGMRKIAALFSFSLIFMGFVFYFINGGFKYGIDFKGGTSIRLLFERPIEIGRIRGILSDIGMGDAEIKAIGTDNEILIRVGQKPNIIEVSEFITNELKAKISDNTFNLQERETVGPKIGAELRRSTVWAMLVALGLILIYISWRFEFKFAIGAVVALFHDVLITLTFFVALKLEITLAVIAALLTIVGYSLNDTIVVFDRIRENLKVLRRENYIRIINISINQTLSRTILTSSTTLIAVIVLFFFGGDVIHNFSSAMLVGIVIGTYSSIYIASPIVVEWHLRSERKKIQK